MISKTIRKNICSTPELIENYEEAVNSPRRYVCHHRKEIDYLPEELIAKGEYYNVPPEDLIFLTYAEHTYLHANVCKGWETYKENMSQAQIVSSQSEEMKKKRSAANKGSNNPMYGKKLSAETKQKMSDSKVGRRWWNNGVDKRWCRECPGEGWVLGRLIKAQK